ncbi:2301_t:CDS:2 [Ambispora gerdemannii]|uniref:2301_t:CDS:1 n=1 Tax=Ambispora gerdemannii TaxID=144530 RepID=A0A9N9ANB2_9GLOM|nr:2301_t:CDS:2 [Ambispora gerdemannii]
MANKLSAETLSTIFEYLTKEQLFPIAFVNKLWCNSVVRVLWRSPFQFYNELIDDEYEENEKDEEKIKKGSAVIRTLMTFLGEDDKKLLVEQGLELPPKPEKPTDSALAFNYPSFIIVFEYTNILLSIEDWLDTSTKLQHQSDQYKILHEEIFKTLSKLIFAESPGIDELTCTTSYKLDLFTIPNAVNCLSKITKFSGDFINISKEFFIAASQHCVGIKHLSLHQCTDDEVLTDFIVNQQKLETLEIKGIDEPLPEVIEVIKRKSSTLKKLVIEEVISLSPTLLVGLENLEEFRLKHFYDPTSEDIQEFSETMEGIAETRFNNLTSLHLLIDEADPEILARILENTDMKLKSFTLSYLKFEGELDANDLWEAIAGFCPVLEKLHLETFQLSEVLNGLPTIFGGCILLRALTISEHKEGEGEYGPFDISDEFAILGPLVPPALQILDLSQADAICTPQALEEFLEGCVERLNKPLLLKLDSQYLEPTHSDVLHLFGEEGFNESGNENSRERIFTIFPRPNSDAADNEQ